MDEQTLNSTLREALYLQQEDNLDEAQKLFEQILSQAPNNADALHGMGLLCAQRRDFKGAVHWLQQAVASAPHIPGFHNNLGNAYKALNKAGDAKRHYNEALRLKKPYPEARNNLGHLLFQQGLFHEAAEHLQKAVREDPEHVDAHYNLGNCYVQMDRLTDAVSHFKQVLQLRPDHLGANHNLGIALTALKDFAQAKPYLQNVLARTPEDVDALFHLGIIEASLGNLNDAIAHYQHTIKNDPTHADAYHNLATVYLHEKKTDEALANYEKAFELNPSNKTAEHMIKALKGVELKEGAPDEYVRALFDQYAYSYNLQVTQQLEYQVPAKLRQALAHWATQATSLWDVLDLGCGTGLCAPYFRDIALKLTGVDLSPNMIEVAQKQGGYDRLEVQGIEGYLNKIKDVFDLILAADVFVYFADLDNVFTLVAQHLKAKGFFAFSVEKSEPDHDKPYHLRTTGRYAHKLTYIQELATKHNFEVIYHEETMLRKQEDEDVMGYLCILQSK